MPRLKQAGREAADDYATAIFDMLFAERDPVKEPGTATGTPGNWWTVFNIVPDAFRHTTDGFRFYRSPNRKLDPKLRSRWNIPMASARYSGASVAKVTTVMGTQARPMPAPCMTVWSAKSD